MGEVGSIELADGASVGEIQDLILTLEDEDRYVLEEKWSDGAIEIRTRENETLPEK